MATESTGLVIGKDTRLSGYMIESAMVSGFTAVGMEVFQVGPLPTPAVAMLTRSMRADLGVMISASHNPFNDNGIKFFGPDGYKLSDEMEMRIEEMMMGDINALLVPAEQIGRAVAVESARERYIEFAKRTLPRNLTLSGLRVVIDCANGADTRSRHWHFGSLVLMVVTVGVDPDGTNINKDCGSTSPKTLCEKVKEVRADIGIALDGDADRVMIADENGQIIDGDQIMAAIAGSWHDRGMLTAGGVVATVMSNLGLERHLKDIGLTLARTRLVTAMWSSICANMDLMLGANNPGILCCLILPQLVMVWFQPCRFWTVLCRVESRLVRSAIVCAVAASSRECPIF